MMRITASIEHLLLCPLRLVMPLVDGWLLRRPVGWSTCGCSMVA
jgi:hypothetical protein